MYIFRPIRASDLDALTTIAMSTEVELPSLPKNKEKLEKKIIKSLDTFAKSTSKTIGGTYFLSLRI